MEWEHWVLSKRQLQLNIIERKLFESNLKLILRILYDFLWEVRFNLIFIFRRTPLYMIMWNPECVCFSFCIETPTPFNVRCHYCIMLVLSWYKRYKLFGRWKGNGKWCMGLLHSIQLYLLLLWWIVQKTANGLMSALLEVVERKYAFEEFSFIVEKDGINTEQMQ